MKKTAIWYCKKNQICVLVKKISDANGGDDIEWLREYARELIETHKENLDFLLNMFTEVEKYSVGVQKTKK